MFNRFTTIFLGKDNCHYTTKEKQTGSATLDGKSQVQYFSKTPPKMPFFYHRRNLYLIGFLLAFIVALLEFMRGRHQNFLLARNQSLHYRFCRISRTLLSLFSCFHGTVRSVCVPACMAGTFRMESIQLFTVLSGDLHSSQTIYPSAKMPYVPFSVADSGTKPAFIPV